MFFNKIILPQLAQVFPHFPCAGETCAKQHLNILNLSVYKNQNPPLPRQSFRAAKKAKPSLKINI